jgi:hypothetical protein
MKNNIDGKEKRKDLCHFAPKSQKGQKPVFPRLPPFLSLPLVLISESLRLFSSFHSNSRDDSAAPPPLCLLCCQPAAGPMMVTTTVHMDKAQFGQTSFMALK